MKRYESALATLTLYALCIPTMIAIILYWLAHTALRRTQHFLGWCFIRFMALTDPNNGGA